MYGGLIMKNFIFGTTTGAIVGAAISMVIPCSDNRFRNKILKKGKKVRSRIIKKVAGIMYKIM